MRRDQFPKKPNDWLIYRRMLSESRAYWGFLIILLLLDLVSTPLALLTPLPIKLVVDHVVGSIPVSPALKASLPDGSLASPKDILLFAALLQILVVLAIQLQSLASYVLSTHVGEALKLHFRGKLFQHVQALSLSFHDARHSSNFIYTIQYDAPAIQWIVAEGLLPLVSSIIMLIALVYVTGQLDWQLAIVALLVSPVLLLCSQQYNRRVRHRYHDVKDLESSAFSVVQETLTAVRVIKAFGGEEQQGHRFFRDSNRSMVGRVKLSAAEGSFGLIINLTMAVGVAGILFLGVHRVWNGTITLGILLMILAYLTQLYGPLRAISQKVAGLQSSLASAQRAFDLLDELPEIAEKPGARSLKNAKGAIEFCAVHFAYLDRLPVLRDISFRIDPGTRVGIAGKTGTGKTTLVSLLLRFYDPVSGKILLDGIDLRQYRLQDLRNQFAIVLQEPVLFSTTIVENITYGRPGASLVEVAEAAKRANAHEFVERLPDGYNTVVGERGVRLSGGERQRIALARAFLKQAPILILDEPTSSVDLQTESMILEALERLMKGRTCLLIAHRFSALKECDLVLTLKEGRILTADPEMTYHHKSI